MATLHLIPPDIADLYEVHEWRNAAGVLSTANPTEWEDLIFGLRQFRLLRSEVSRPGGRRSLIVHRLEEPFHKRNWTEREFKTAIRIDDTETPSPTHSVDCFKGRVAMEVEWNNKDPFFDRDLNNFRLLFDLRVIDAGVIVTRADHLQAIFNEIGRGQSYGASTTHMSKLLPKIQGGGGGGCPILVFGITRKLYVEDEAQDAGEAAQDSEAAIEPEPGEESGE